MELGVINRDEVPVVVNDDNVELRLQEVGDLLLAARPRSVRPRGLRIRRLLTSTREFAAVIQHITGGG